MFQAYDPETRRDGVTFPALQSDSYISQNKKEKSSNSGNVIVPFLKRESFDFSISYSLDPNLNVNIPDVFASAPNDDFRK